MAYENIGTPSGNNLYITIPVRGTKNWDEKIKDGFFQKVSDHDHTPGKGARITLPALDSTLQNAIAQVTTNTTNIAQNAIDINDNTILIAANTTNITTNTTNLATTDAYIATRDTDINANTTGRLANAANISSNSTDITTLETSLTAAESDITALDSRVTSLESAPSNVIVVSSQADANALAATTENSFIDISSGLTITSKEFKNCEITVDGTATFSSCNFNSSDMRAKDSTLSSITLNDAILYSCTLSGFNAVNFYVVSANVTLHRVNIPTSYGLIDFDGGSDPLKIISIHDSQIRGYRVRMIGRGINTFYSNISPVYNLIMAPDVDLGIVINSHTILKSQHIYNNDITNYKIALDPGTDVYSSDPITSGYVNFTNEAGTVSYKTQSNNIKGYKIIDGVVTEFDKGNTEVMVSARGAVVSIGNNTNQPVISGTGASYDPDSIVSNGDVTLDAGNYLISALVNIASAGQVSLNVIITPSGGVANTIFTITNGTDPVSLNDLLIEANQGDVLSVKFNTQISSQSATTLYTLKKIV